MIDTKKKSLEQAKKFSGNSYQILDGTVPDIFQRTTDYVPEDIKRIKKPILGYLGTISERMDIELLEFISRELPFVSIVLIGDIHFQRTDITRLRKIPNIFFLGGKEYKTLGNYTRNFDVCILPYIPRLTESFPTKVLDYLATGKPIVSTNLVEVDRFKDCLYISNSKEEFVRFIKTAINENNPDLFRMRQEIAKKNTWVKRAEEIIEIINMVKRS